MNIKSITKKELEEKLKEIRKMGYVPSVRHHNHGGVGNTLENLLGIEENNLPIANAAEWELKAQRLPVKSLTTLFHMEPSPKALRFVPKILLPKYGWPHREAGAIYNQDERSFRQTLNAKEFTDRGFTVEFIKAENKIALCSNESRVSEKHDHWLKEIKRIHGKFDLETPPYWGIDDLFAKLACKLHNCFYAQASHKKEDGQEYFYFEKFFRLSKLSKEKFILEFQNGNIFIDFDARTGHNHGTKFRIRETSFKSLYEDVYKF